MKISLSEKKLRLFALSLQSNVFPAARNSYSLGVGLLRFARIFAMDRSDIVTLPIFDLRQCYLSLFTFRDQVAESTFCALVAESTFRTLVVESN